MIVMIKITDIIKKNKLTKIEINQSKLKHYTNIIRARVGSKIVYCTILIIMCNQILGQYKKDHL